jgi:hypothetical protein
MDENQPAPNAAVMPAPSAEASSVSMIRTGGGASNAFLFLACIGDSRILCIAEQDQKSLSSVYYNITSFMLH